MARRSADDQATSWEDQQTPSGELRAVPAWPTATNSPSRQATPLSQFVVPEVCEVHSVPSDEVRMVPSAPTAANRPLPKQTLRRSEEHTSELQSRFGISYAVFCLKKKN